MSLRGSACERLGVILFIVKRDGPRLLDEVALRCLRVGDSEGLHLVCAFLGLVDLVWINPDRHLLLQPVSLGPLPGRLSQWLRHRSASFRRVAHPCCYALRSLSNTRRLRLSRRSSAGAMAESTSGTVTATIPARSNIPG